MKRAPSERHCRWADDEAANLQIQDCAMRGKLPTEPRGPDSDAQMSHYA